MPVRYDIAAGVPQQQAGGFDPLNAFATMQAMNYRQQQNALAQMQMEKEQREAQREMARMGLFARQGFNPLSQQGLLDIARTDPEYFRQFVTPFAGYRAERARESAIYGGERRATELQPYAVRKAVAEAGGEEAKIPGIKAETRKKRGEATISEMAAAREILRSVYLAGSPEKPGAFEDEYARRYPELLAVAPNLAKTLGPRPDLEAIERAVTSEKSFEEARKPMLGEPNKLFIQPTGRPNERPRAVEPRYVPPPNALAPTIAPLNALAAPPPMMGDENLTPQERIVQKNIRNRALLDQVPPEDRPKVQSQLDLAETVQAANQGLRRLADASGISVAGQTKVENWKAKARTTEAGLALGNLSDSEVAEEYNNLRAIAGIMRQRVAGAIGLTARQMDAAKEMEAFEKIVGSDPSAEGLASAVRRLNTINQLLGTGEAERFESPRSAPRGKAGEEPKLKPLEGTINLEDMRD